MTMSLPSSESSCPAARSGRGSEAGVRPTQRDLFVPNADAMACRGSGRDGPCRLIRLEPFDCQPVLDGPIWFITCWFSSVWRGRQLANRLQMGRLLSGLAVTPTSKDQLLVTQWSSGQRGQR
jgi:hypothetical protein